MTTSEQIKELETKGYKVTLWNKKPTEVDKRKLPLIKINEEVYLVQKIKERKW